VSPNRRLQTARRAAGLSQGQLAERVNAVTGRDTMDANTISRLERGAIRWPGKRTREALAGVLGVPVAELGFERVTEAVRAAEEKPWTVGPDALGAVATILSGLRRLEDTTSSAMVSPAVDVHLHTTATFAKEAGSAHRQQAVTLAAEMSTYRGWLAIDLADWDTAARRLNDAVALALAAQAQNLLVEAIGFQSYAALKRGERVAAVSLRHAATPLARTPVERAVAGLHLARALAITGDVPASDHALVEADTAIEAAEGADRDDHHYYVTDSWLQVQHGLVHAYAGRRQEAARDIETGLSGMPEQQRESAWAREYVEMLDRVS
jgi:transcriptional regulator with XRE-family HTH domain